MQPRLLSLPEAHASSVCRTDSGITLFRRPAVCSKSAWAAQSRHMRHATCRAMQRVAAAAASADRAEGCLTVEEVQTVAAARGLAISLKTLGPLYRIVCREGGENGKVLGVTSGFIVPVLGLMHCDTLQIFTKGIKGEDGDRVRGGALGLGLLMGAMVFAFGNAAGCRKAEILAINDDDATHARLVRYYSRFGFEPVYEVTGGSLADLPHMLVWGGVGTRLDADVQAMERRWREAVRRSAQRGGSAAAPAETPAVGQ